MELDPEAPGLTDEELRERRRKRAIEVMNRLVHPNRERSPWEVAVS